MPFSFLFEEVAETEIIDKLFVVVERDMKAALDAKYPAANYPKFAVMAKANLDQFNYPLLIAGNQRMRSRETESGEWLDQILEVGAGIVVKDTSAPAVKTRIERYVRAFKAVVRKDVLELLPSASATVGYELEIDHQYFRHKTKGTDFIQEVELQIRIHFGEK
jgi:hypothetical protein